MLEVKIWESVSSRSCFTSTMRGAKANQHTKAMKKDIHAKWKARMCGRAKEKSWISLALKPSEGSTGMEPEYHLPDSFWVNLRWRRFSTRVEEGLFESQREIETATRLSSS